MSGSDRLSFNVTTSGETLIAVDNDGKQLASNTSPQGLLRDVAAYARTNGFVSIFTDFDSLCGLQADAVA